MGKKIQRIVKEILDELKINKAPVYIEKVCNRLGIEVIYEELENDISGFLYKKPQQNTIVVNRDHYSNRQRFTIAHELGHLILNHIGDLFVDREGRFMFRDANSQSGIDKQEREANRFAAEILMPEEFVIKALDKLDTEILEDEDIKKLADSFGVSAQAMAIRLANLNLVQM